VNSWKVILATLVIFVTGVVTGALLFGHSGKSLPLMRKGSSTNVSPPGTNGVSRSKIQPPLTGPLRKDFLDRLDKELQLSAQQRERVEKIISEGQENTRELWDLVEPEIYAEMIGAKARIRQELTPEQAEHFAECLKKRPAAKPATNAPPALPLTNAPAAQP
jgi:hypothetical protein